MYYREIVSNNLDSFINQQPSTIQSCMLNPIYQASSSQNSSFASSGSLLSLSSSISSVGKIDDKKPLSHVSSNTSNLDNSTLQSKSLPRFKFNEFSSEILHSNNHINDSKISPLSYTSRYTSLPNSQINQVKNKKLTFNDQVKEHIIEIQDQNGSIISNYYINEEAKKTIAPLMHSLSDELQRNSIQNNKNSINANSSSTGFNSTETTKNVCNQVLNNKCSLYPENSFATKTSKLIPIVTKSKQEDFSTSIHVGDFDIENISVQLFDDQINNKKLFIHCFQVEPIQSMSGNYIKKEFKQEVQLPNDIDINSIESYLHNRYLTIKCKYMSQRSKPIIENPNGEVKQMDLNNSNQLFSTSPYYQTNNSNILGKTLSSSPKAAPTRSILKSTDSSTSPKNTRLKKSLISDANNSRSTISNKSVHFEMDNSTIESKDSSICTSKPTTYPNCNLIRDGYSCITKDGLDKIYLTYFFRLPSCSPSDRTQVRIENHCVLKLKIIQEKKIKDFCNTNKLNDFESIKPIDTERIMIREFSRRCRLPINSFLFDEDGISVSFINDVLVRVEIPIKHLVGQKHESEEKLKINENESNEGETNNCLKYKEPKSDDSKNEKNESKNELNESNEKLNDSKKDSEISLLIDDTTTSDAFNDSASLSSKCEVRF